MTTSNIEFDINCKEFTPKEQMDNKSNILIENNDSTTTIDNKSNIITDNSDKTESNITSYKSDILINSYRNRINYRNISYRRVLNNTHSRFIIPNNILNYCIYNNIDTFNKTFISTLNNIFYNFYMKCQNEYSTIIYKIPQQYIYYGNYIKSPLYFVHFINDGSYDSFDDLIKSSLSKTAIYMIFEYSSFSNNRFVLVYDNKDNITNRYNYRNRIINRNITSIIENNLISKLDERLYIIKQLNNYNNSYKLVINEKVIFNLIINFLFYVMPDKFTFTTKEICPVKQCNRYNYAHLINRKFNKSNKQLCYDFNYNKVVFISMLYNHKTSFIIDLLNNNNTLYYKLTYIKNHINITDNSKIYRYVNNNVFLLKNISKYICYETK